MVARADASPSVFCDVAPTYQRILDAVRAATADEPTRPQVAAAQALRKPRARRGTRKATLPNLCGQHPTYGAKRPPRTPCSICWAAYEKYAGKVAAQRARKKKGME